MHLSASALRRLVAALFVLSLCAGLAQAQVYEHHAQVRFWLDTAMDREALAADAGRLDIATRGDGYVDIIVPLSELPNMLSRGSRVEVIHDDLETFYASRLGDRDTQGDFGAYHTFSESVAWMDSLRDSYPNVISARWSLGQGWDGNDLWCFRVSDNPDTDEAGEPEILFDGMHHAREIMAAEMPMMLAEYLCQQYYAGDPDIVNLVNGNEIYFVPIVNPDGFLYNELTNPNGGGMWRKNRRNNGDGTYGVDNNRNYPYEWGCSWGSSGYTGDETYRGPSAGSEPETQAIMAFINAHDFVVRQSFHTYGELTLYPWGYTTDDTVDEDIFREIAAAMVQFNGYTPGQPGEVLYDVCGGNFDWDYGAQTEHTKIFGVSTEIGNDGFWPASSRRQQLFDENLWPSLYLIDIAGTLRSVSWQHAPLPFTPSGGGSYTAVGVPQGYEGADIAAGSVALFYRVNGGAFVQVAMSPTGQPGEFGAGIPAQSQGSVVEYYLSASDVSGHTGTSPRNAPDALHYFEVNTAFDHAMELDRGWLGGAPGDDASTGIWVRVDPVGTAAQPEDDHTPMGTMCWVTGQHLAGQTIGYNDVDSGTTTLLSPTYDFTGATAASLSYWRWYSNDQGSAPGEDYWDVYASNDGGQTWTSLEHTLVSSNAWESHSVDLLSLFPTPGLIQVKFVASDLGSGSIVEGAVDDFSIAGVFDTTDAGDGPSAFTLSLDRAYPNPFNPKTTIAFVVPEAGFVTLGIYDAQGRMVRSLLAEPLPAGPQAVSWNGRDAMGRPAASGIYFVRLAQSGVERSQKLVLAK